MSKSYLSEPERFTRNPKLSAETQFQRNLDDFQRLVKSDVKAFEHKCLTAELVIKNIQESIKLYDKEQEALLNEILDVKKD